MQWFGYGNKNCRLPDAQIPPLPLLRLTPVLPIHWRVVLRGLEALVILSCAATDLLISHGLSGATWRQARVLGGGFSQAQRRASCRNSRDHHGPESGTAGTLAMALPLPSWETGRCPGSSATEPQRWGSGIPQPCAFRHLFCR